ncbi:hypothetical protein [Pseudoalteromonas porphyrae]|uniref:hypothetical protein n=1 Tax=Pseudoalteromonas porphyrae TaxID=187330 RepID=UPI000A3F84B6|nr:hypothetical protein [Pseudoalteromonas porphyrae]
MNAFEINRLNPVALKRLLNMDGTWYYCQLKNGNTKISSRQHKLSITQLNAIKKK